MLALWFTPSLTVPGIPDQQGEEGDNLGGEQGGPGDFQTGLQSRYSRKYGKIEEE